MMSSRLLPSRADPDNDPRLWLEEVEGAKAIAWVESQNQRTFGEFAGEAFEADTEALTHIFDSPDNIPYIGRRGAHVYNFWKDVLNPRGLWRRTTLESYRTDNPDWEIILDLDALALAEARDWIWGSPKVLSRSHDRALLSLSLGGSDAHFIREFDIPTRSFVSDGFNLPEAKQGAAWIDRDTLIVASTLGEGHQTTCGYAKSVRIWKRGTPFESAEIIFTVQLDHMNAWVAVDHTALKPRIWLLDQIGFFDCAVYLMQANGEHKLVDLPSDAYWQAHREFIALKLRTAWTLNGVTYAPDTLLGATLSDVLAGKPEIKVLFKPKGRVTLKRFCWSGDRIVASISNNLKPQFIAFLPDENGWHPSALPALPDDGVVDLWPFDNAPEDTSGEFLVALENPVTPATFLLFQGETPPAILKRAPAIFESTGIIITRHEARTVDGELIPYMQVGPKSGDGHAPVLMQGYGGFGLSEAPHYRSSIGKLWLEKGGTHIRGGGEFGTGWHKAGMREGKALSHDDFAAIAADLVKRGITVPSLIAAGGGSNGGILISNMLTRYPERFGALFCTIPLIDMRRYTKLLAGASWIAEYGDPAKPEDWAFLQTISAYHNVEAGRKYPPILIATTRKDDRVHPGHARKMAAKLQELGHAAWFYESATGGHGYGKDNRERASFIALGYSFLRRAISCEI